MIETPEQFERAEEAITREYATSQGRTVITGDEDFLALDAQWRSSGRHYTGIIYLSPDRKDAIGRVVESILFLHHAVAAGAAELATDVYNQVIRI